MTDPERWRKRQQPIPMESHDVRLSPAQEKVEIERSIAEMVAHMEAHGITPVFVEMKAK